MTKNEIQVSDSLICGIILAVSGGCMDAYSYLFRDGVFANAQTGNMLLVGVNFAEGNVHMALKYLWPVVAFAVGIIFSDVLKHKDNKLGELHWRQISVAIEAAIMVFVAFLTEDHNQLANALISFACGIQVESFRTIRGSSIATTMCIGNLRSGMFNFDEFLHTRDRKYLRRSLLYYGVILAFVIGAIIESYILRVLGQKAILLSAMLLVVALIYMFKPAKPKKEM